MNCWFLKLKRSLIMVSLFGIVFLLCEAIFRGVQNFPELKAVVSLWMVIVGGVSVLVLGKINSIDFVRKNINAFFQNIIGSIIITIVEFVSGLILNIFFGFDIWSYLRLKYDLLAQISLGQVSFTFMGIWFLASPFAYWLHDHLEYKFFKIGNSYSILKVYSQLFLFWIKPGIQEERKKLA